MTTDILIFRRVPGSHPRWHQVAATQAPSRPAALRGLGLESTGDAMARDPHGSLYFAAWADSIDFEYVSLPECNTSREAVPSASPRTTDRKDRMTNLPPELAALRTPGVALVLDAVRATGRTAHPTAPARVSGLVADVAAVNGLDRDRLQAEVNAFADMSDQLVCDRDPVPADR
jgi:hypothetical protein